MVVKARIESLSKKDAFAVVHQMAASKCMAAFYNGNFLPPELQDLLDMISSVSSSGTISYTDGYEGDGIESARIRTLICVDGADTLEMRSVV